jgi:PEP-CTERM/exosortase A-associated glycosyltransferase
LREQRQRGWETYQLTGPKQGQYSAPEEMVDQEWLFYRTPAAQRMKKIPVLNQLDVISQLSKRLLQVAKDVKPDILHAHSPALNAIAALHVGRQLGIPVVYEIRAFWEDAAVDHGTSVEGGLRYRLSRALETYAIHRVNAITTICEGLRAEIIARGVASDRVSVIPNAVDIDSFQQSTVSAIEECNFSSLAKRLGLEGNIVLGFIGSFYAYEGLNLLLEAMPAMIAAQPAVKLLLVGGGVQEEALKQQAERLGIHDHVVFTGRVPHAEVPHYYNLIDILIYPRHRMRLTELVTPLKPLEAMAQGRLLVASDVGGHKELIEDNVTGWLFSAGDANALAARVLQLIDAPERWPILRKAAREFVERERTWKSSVARYENIYAALIKTP